jgi:hypothetical protein
MQMVLSVFCRYCDRNFRLEFPTPELRNIRELEFCDMDDYIKVLKESFTCVQWRGQAGVKLSIQ